MYGFRVQSVRAWKALGLGSAVTRTIATASARIATVLSLHLPKRDALALNHDDKQNVDASFMGFAYEHCCFLVSLRQTRKPQCRVKTARHVLRPAHAREL